jgi:hypothetical protein
LNSSKHNQEQWEQKKEEEILLDFMMDSVKLIIIEIRSTLRKVDSSFMIVVPSQVIKGLKLMASDNNYWTLNTLLL